MKTTHHPFSRRERLGATIKRHLLRVKAGWLSNFGDNASAGRAWKDVWVHEVIHLPTDDPRRSVAMLNCACHYLDARDTRSLNAGLALVDKALALLTATGVSSYWKAEEGRALWYKGRAYDRLGDFAKGLSFHLAADSAMNKVDASLHSRYHNLQDMSWSYRHLNMPMMAQDASERAQACWAVLAAANMRHPYLR
jgi:hypothetical protein